MGSLRILVAEDSEDDIFFLKRSFRNAGVTAPLDFVEDGQEALDYLHARPPLGEPAKPRPTMLLLDLNMPRLNGFDVIQHVRQDPELRRLIIVVLTNSAQPEHVRRAYDLGANSYVV